MRCERAFLQIIVSIWFLAGRGGEGSRYLSAIQPSTFPQTKTRRQQSHRFLGVIWSPHMNFLSVIGFPSKPRENRKISWVLLFPSLNQKNFSSWNIQRQFFIIFCRRFLFDWHRCENERETQTRLTCRQWEMNFLAATWMKNWYVFRWTSSIDDVASILNNSKQSVRCKKINSH